VKYNHFLGRSARGVRRQADGPLQTARLTTSARNSRVDEGREVALRVLLRWPDERCEVETRDAHSGGSQHTARLRPWDLVVSVEFGNGNSAVAFERYLKTGSGRAFAKRHFI
jgi:hypothetical protein